MPQFAGQRRFDFEQLVEARRNRFGRKITLGKFEKKLLMADFAAGDVAIEIRQFAAGQCCRDQAEALRAAGLDNRTQQQAVEKYSSLGCRACWRSALT